MKYLSTSDLAKAVGIHPNTVRRYVDRGILPPVERSPSGYRRFTQRHLDDLRLAHLVYFGQFPGKTIRDSGISIVQAAVRGDLAGARVLAERHLTLVNAERAHADIAASLLEHWAFSAPDNLGPNEPRLLIGQVAKLLNVTIDVLRNWDRSGLIEVPRHPTNRYRRYGPQEISRLRIIRMLSRSGFSMSAILRMLIKLDQGERTNLRQALDTPRPDEDVFLASDHWISTLTEQEQRARALIALLDTMLQNQAGGRA